ncbi:MAG: hypothetical protein SP4CHLAM5_08870 [Chlamydiia bacterium]|nr:hypothetical protein [Chlamydiia bacterium]MCH9624510.1 hypothetical protein [Chlamydiia bacterium]
MAKRVLYTGVDPSGYSKEDNFFHFPLVSLHMRSLSVREIKDVFEKIYSYSHILFTTKYGVQSFFRCMSALKIPKEHLEPVFLLAVGEGTKRALEQEGVYITYVGSDETEQGAIRMLEALDLEDANILLPQAGITRAKLIHYLVEKSISYEVIILYDLIKQRPYTEVDLADFDKVIFTTPVAVEAFFDIYDDIPVTLDVLSMGLATRCRIKHYLDLKSKQIAQKV